MKKTLLALSAVALVSGGQAQAYRLVDRQTAEMYNKVIKVACDSKKLWNEYCLHSTKPFRDGVKGKLLTQASFLEGKPFSIVLPSVSAMLCNISPRSSNDQKVLLKQIINNIAFLESALSYAHAGKKLEFNPHINWHVFINAIEDHIRDLMYHMKNSLSVLRVNSPNSCPRYVACPQHILTNILRARNIS